MWTGPASGNYKLRAEHGRPSGHCGESSSFITARACDPLASAGDRPLFEWRGSSTCRSKVGRIFPLQRRGHTMRCAVLHPLRRTIGRQNKIYCPSTTTKACPLFIFRLPLGGCNKLLLRNPEAFLSSTGVGQGGAFLRWTIDFDPCR